jgi:dCMP deaminase|tara:strand:- start:122 stop:565 length:444 start_codon:yes stop_codon:yes gene_type:complete
MPNYNKYFRRILKETAEMSTCARVQVGCVIARDGRIISTGWNGVPAGLQHCDNKYAFGAMPEPDMESHHEWSTKHELHAETNAIGYAAKNGVSTKGAALYTSVSPCIDCAKLIIAAGIEQVYWTKKYDRSNDGWEFLSRNNTYMEQL